MYKRIIDSKRFQYSVSNLSIAQIKDMWYITMHAQLILNEVAMTIWWLEQQTVTIVWFISEWTCVGIHIKAEMGPQCNPDALREDRHITKRALWGGNSIPTCLVTFNPPL